MTNVFRLSRKAFESLVEQAENGSSPKEEPPLHGRPFQVNSGTAPPAISEPNQVKEDFPFRELDTESNEIRLLTIQPAQSLDAPLVCDLEYASLDDVPKYEALSYTWGSPINPVTIMINNQHFKITHNLYTAMSYLRLSNSSRTLWIDAICINQLSIPERNIQVLRMRAIYRQSHATLIWLGPAFKNSDLLMEFMAWEDRRILDPTYGGGDAEWASERYEREMGKPENQPVWEALKELTLVPYWNRMWVIQEVAFGAKPIICVGTKTVGFWDALIRVLSSLDAELELGDSGMPVNETWTFLITNAKARAMAVEKRDVEKKKGPSWLAASLQRYRGSLATDPRDKLIALLGFLDESDMQYNKFITVDYARPVKELYLDIFRFCTSEPRRAITDQEIAIGSRTEFTRNMNITGEQITTGTEVPMSRAHGPCNIMTAASIRHSGIDDFPSWLPHWGHDLPCHSIDDLTGNRFRASQSSGALYSISPDNRILTSFGLAITSLSNVGESHKSLNPEPLNLATTVVSWYDLAKKHSPINGFQSSIFWRTLAFDSYLNRQYFSAPEEWYKLTPKWLLSFTKSAAKSGNTKPDKKFLTNEYILWLQKTTRGRKFALTQEGIMAVVPEEAEKGDTVVSMWGCDIPLLLRKVELEKWVLVGECFVWGIMDGSVLNQAVMLGMEAEDFEII
ncbi:HET domain-containing protein [Rutstroemia sp. NJR-2017a WRK4]|nr:HET domain-containing protein [Rutstroemia sp. NJR-2017a WRK4]